MSEEFAGNARYQIVRRLGAGGMGIVYEAIDNERASQRVALKVLRGKDPEALVRIKREFRSLADVHHPNLVALHDLVADGDTCFFTLELVEGVDFLQWVWPGSDETLRDLPTAAVDATLPSPAPSSVRVDHARLSSALRQLAQGVAALHAAGRLHRDLKPSNVLVTPEGRVVILDFGLVAELDGEASITELQGHTIVGTAAYMAPEQAGSGPVTPAADWYAVGSMLYQALTGRLPFDGSPMQTLVDKQRMAPPAPSERARNVPPELEQLCLGLLRREPRERAGAAGILATLGGAPAQLAAAKIDQGFVGREDELATLQAAFDQSRRGEPRVVRVCGGSGIGKTALVRQFLAQAEAGGAVVLAGRCYERESVPFKALDSAIDALARHLGQLPEDKADALLPRDAWALARMFPVLRRVEAIARAPVREVREAHELRRRATAALREIFGRITDRAPLVVFIDDLQWSDQDSAALLEELLKPPDAPAMLLIVTSREEAGAAPGREVAAVELKLSPLAAADALALARRALAGDSPTRAEQVARESGGNPALLQQLAAFGAETRLDEVVLARAAQLDEPARRVLEAVCLAGRPVDARVAARAVGLTADDAPIRVLKGARLVRATPAGDRERLEAWHERIRDTVVANLKPQQQQALHLGLAEALAALAPDELDAYAMHLQAAGETAGAAKATSRAAKVAAEQLAFDRAATLYSQALALLPKAAAQRHELGVSLGDCLADAGRGAEAAAAYATALTTATASEALELKRRRAEQLLRSGHVDAGIEALREVLGEVGMTLAPEPWRALVALSYRRVYLGLRGLDFTEVAEAAVDPLLLRKIDVCWSVSIGLAMIDTLRGASFQTRGLLLALDAGEPYRLSRALTAEASFVATIGHRAEARAARLIKEAQRLALRVGDPRLTGLIEFCDGQTRFLVGRWRESLTHHAEAERLFREAGAAVTWEAASTRVFELWSLFYLGELRELSKRQPALLDEARRRGDRYTTATLHTGLAIVAALAADQPDQGRQNVREMLSTWSTGGFHFQHYWALLAEGMIDLYRGDGEACWRRLNEGIPRVKSAGFLRIQNVRIEARFLRAQGALASGRLGLALADAERIEGEAVGWARAFAALIRGGVAAGRGMKARAEELLNRALELFEANEMALFAAATRVRLGELEGGELGAARIKAGHAAMLAQAVKDPVALTRTLAAAAPPGNSTRAPRRSSDP